MHEKNTDHRLFLTQFSPPILPLNNLLHFILEILRLSLPLFRDPWEGLLNLPSNLRSGLLHLRSSKWRSQGFDRFLDSFCDNGTKIWVKQKGEDNGDPSEIQRLCWKEAES